MATFNLTEGFVLRGNWSKPGPERQVPCEKGGRVSFRFWRFALGHFLTRGTSVAKERERPPWISRSGLLGEFNIRSSKVIPRTYLLKALILPHA